MIRAAWFELIGSVCCIIYLLVLFALVMLIDRKEVPMSLLSVLKKIAENQDKEIILLQKMSTNLEALNTNFDKLADILTKEDDDKIVGIEVSQKT